MDAKIIRKLTPKETKIIADIEEKASKRKHVPKYTPKWIVEYMLESFNDFNYDGKEDGIDMLNAIFEIALKCNVMTEKQIEINKKDMMQDVGRWSEDEE
jgi:hypothetical protein